MSLSKCYTSTPETTNKARLARLILGPCTDVLRDILKTEVKPSDLSRKLKEFTDKLPHRQRNPLNKSQSEIIFPKPTKQYSGDYSDLDISLLYLLLRNVSKIPPHSKGWGEVPDPVDRSVAANIERIRLLRNQYYGHAADLSLSETEFRQEWLNIRDIVVELERHLGTSTVYQDAVNKIKTCSMDPEQEKKYIDLLGDIRQLHTTVDDLSSNMRIIQRNLVLHDPRLARKIETTMQMIQNHYEAVSHLFVKTRTYVRAKELLDNNGYVVIKGNPGTGKTTIAKMLMKELMDEGKSPLQLYKFKDLYGSISAGDGIVVFIDNLFGEFTLYSDDVQECKARVEMIKVLIASDDDYKSNKLIFALRNDIYQEYEKNECDDDFLMSSLVDLSSKENALLKEEIVQLSENYELSEYTKDEELIYKVSKMPLAIGFPQCCKLARSNEDFKQNVFAFIPNAMMFLRDYFKALLKKRTVKTAVLVYLLLNGGNVESELINNPRLDLEMKRASLEFVGLQNSHINDFQDSIYCFVGFLITHDTIENTYKFTHSSVQESLFSVSFNFDSEKMIQMCYPSLLLTLTTCKNHKSTQVYIEQRLFKYVVSRIANIVAERSVIGYSSISSLDLWNDSNFLEHVLQSEECTSKFKTHRDTMGNSLIVHFSRAGNKRWVEYLLPHSDKRTRYRSLNAACSKNKADIVNLILSWDVECDLQTCFNAVQSGNIELLLRVCELVDLHQISHSLHPDWNSIKHSLLKEICFMQQTQLIEQILEKYPFLVDIMDDQGSNSLQSAASSGDKHAFNLLLKFGFDPYEKDRENGHTVLTCACQKGRTDMVKYLIDKYPALLKEHTDIRGKNLLHWAAFSGKIDMFEYMLNIFENDNILHVSSDNKPRVDKTDNRGQSILHAACKAGHYDMCKYLLYRYPQLLDVCANNGKETVLHCAAQGGNLDIFKFLLSKGLNVNYTTNIGETVLHKCCFTGREEMFRYLINMYPSFISVRDNDGWTVLHSACGGGSIEIVTFLIQKGLDVNALSNNGRSILHIACLYEKFEVCEYLVENYPHLLDVKDKARNTVLHDAAWGGNVQIVKLLIEKKMDIFALQKDDETILHQCCRSCEMEMCEYVVNNFSDLLEIRDNKGWTVLHSACCGGRVDIISFLIKKGSDINELANNGKSILHIACLYGKFEICKYLVEIYPHLLYVRDKSSNTVLHDAARGGNVQIVKLLIEKTNDIYTQQGGGETILHQCCLSGEIEMCEYLVNQFSELIKIKDNKGWTALHSACGGGSLHIVSFLLNKGFDINVLSNVGESVLHIACLNSKHDVCRHLSTYHPDLIAVIDNKGKSVIDTATEHGDVDMVHILRERRHQEPS